MNPRTSVGQAAPELPPEIASQPPDSVSGIEAAARRQLLDLVDHGRVPAWVRPAVGAGLVALGVATLASNLLGGG